jgi:hypothetical protein
MKKICITGIMAAICGIVHAASISPTSIPTMVYTSGYEWGISKSTLGNVSSLSSFSITINTTVGTSTTSSSLYIDLIGATAVAANGFTATGGNSESGSDFWQTSPNNTAFQIQLGAPNYGVDASNPQDNLNYTTITFAVGSTALNDLNYDLANYGGFNIAFDPNCTYTTSSLRFNYSVPDTAATAVLLGMSFLGLMVFRRKFALS